jgi:hypothetical protein
MPCCWILRFQDLCKNDISCCLSRQQNITHCWYSDEREEVDSVIIIGKNDSFEEL